MEGFLGSQSWAVHCLRQIYMHRLFVKAMTSGFPCDDLAGFCWSWSGCATDRIERAQCSLFLIVGLLVGTALGPRALGTHMKTERKTNSTMVDADCSMRLWALSVGSCTPLVPFDRRAYHASVPSSDASGSTRAQEHYQRSLSLTRRHEPIRCGAALTPVPTGAPGSIARREHERTLQPCFADGL